MRKARVSSRLDSAAGPYCAVYFRACAFCETSFVARSARRVYCRDYCRTKELRRATSGAADARFYINNSTSIKAAARTRYAANKVAILDRQKRRRAQKRVGPSGERSQCESETREE